MKTINCDVAIVGAGPAGCMAAEKVAEKGHQVILIERNKEIGFPVRCAEGTNTFIFDDTGIEKREEFISQTIEGTNIYYCKEVYELTGARWRGYTLERRIFDKYLASRAEKNGAKILMNTAAVGLEYLDGGVAVDVISNNDVKKIKAKIVVGADGFDSTVGRLAGIRKMWAPNQFCKCFEYVLTNITLKDPFRFHIAFGEEFRGGYGWIFPKKDGLANVGVGVHPKCDSRNILNSFIEEHPIISKFIGENYRIIEKRGGCVPVSGPLPLKEVVADNILLVGDAAGMVDPITAEGIVISMISGIAAGETINSCLLNGVYSKSALSSYYYGWREKRYAGNIKLGRDLDKMTKLRPLFFKIFNKRVPKIMRKLFISYLL